ncbi:helix-turn-helix transcriptional regulator [Tepidanaerobacter acetatoxydans]|uniref:helix-turn-helix transcriptional regulator n=1 Tax=Tepidanaerobacter acetatoxydans TaxID=499229 RepID=UPI001BD48744|nr:helix-turn-helix transcriptional regulator [Tepidanaerobacter acetatoxydans]
MAISLTEVRNLKGKTQAQMAKMLGIGVSTYNLYENGGRKVPEKIATKIAKILEVDKNDIFLPATFTVSKTNKKQTA